jgi:hypothetical protein
LRAFPCTEQQQSVGIKQTGEETLINPESLLFEKDKSILLELDIIILLYWLFLKTCILLVSCL